MALGVCLAITALMLCVGADQALALPSPPFVVTGSASSVGETSATLQGSVNPEGSTVSDCHFEYGTSTSYGLSVPCEQSVGAGSQPVAVSATIGGLQPGTVYYFALTASNAGGPSQGSGQLFLTAGASSGPIAPISGSEEQTPSEPTSGTPPRSPVGPCGKLTGRRRAQCLAALNKRYQPSGTDAGLYVAYCPQHAGASSLRASTAGTSEAGWPPKQCLKMDKGPAGRRHTLVGLHGVHNWLLGGYGNDTIIGGNVGDLIWADYQPKGEPRWQSATIRAGNGRNVIYANDTVNYVWTGTNPRTVVHAHASGISGVIHCQSSGIVVFLSTVSERHFKLEGCRHISHFSVGY